MIEIERILEKCGDCNRFQGILLLLFCLINLLSAMHYYSQTVISFVPRYWCADGLNDALLSEQQQQLEKTSSVSLRNITTPIVSSCLQVGATGTDNGTTVTSCGRFEYDLYMGYHSLTSELDWICDSAWKLTLGQSMFFVGSVVGSLTFGLLADVVGRLPILIASNVIAMIGNLLTIFGTSVGSFCAFRFISGLATDSNFVMMYILVMEYIRPSLRTIGLSICIGIFYCIGSMAAPWIAIAMGTWQGFLIATSLPFAIVPLFYFIVPESVHWLVTRQEYARAVECLRRVAKINGRIVEQATFKEFIDECQRNLQHTNKQGPSILGLFRTPRLRRNTLILFFKSMVITLCYDAVSRNVQGLGISPFVMFSISATTILPACLLLILLQDRIGRKAMASISLLISGVFISTTGMVLFENDKAIQQSATVLVTLSVIGRFGVTVAYNSGAQYATELIPTCVRGQGVAIVHVMGYAFTFFSSYILHTRAIFPPMPEMILGFISLLGAALCLLLPETLNRTLPSTLEDAENFGKNEPWFSFSFLEKRSQSVDALTTQGSLSSRNSLQFS